MDVRHGFCNTWRRTSPSPVVFRTCTPGSAVPPPQRRASSGRQAPRQNASASPDFAVSDISTTATDSPALGAHEGIYLEPLNEASCVPDVACPAVLQTRLSKAHSSAASAALVVQDTPDEKLVATASLDKGMAIWRFYSPHGEDECAEVASDESIEVTRLKVPGAPVFSLAKIPDVLPDGTIVRKRKKPSGIYLGTASKEVVTWMLGSKDVTDKVVLDGHTGWVRSLAVTGKWLFSCGCNCLRQWDTTFRTPKESQVVRLFTGDILSIQASDGRVYTAGADGSLRSWVITRGGELEEGPCQERAHEGRVAACVVGGGRIYTVSYDGSVKAWSASTLELLAEVPGAHMGEKIFCATLGPNGVLFTGGDDKLIRAWGPDLKPVGDPLDGHTAAVRVLAAGRRALLVSGDANGDVCIWETYPVDLPPVVQPPSPPTAAAVEAADGLGFENDVAAVAAASAAATPTSTVDLTLGSPSAMDTIHQDPQTTDAAAAVVAAVVPSEPVVDVGVDAIEANATEATPQHQVETPSPEDLAAAPTTEAEAEPVVLTPAPFAAMSPGPQAEAPQAQEQSDGGGGDGVAESLPWMQAEDGSSSASCSLLASVPAPERECLAAGWDLGAEGAGDRSEQLAGALVPAAVEAAMLEAEAQAEGGTQQLVLAVGEAASVDGYSPAEEAESVADGNGGCRGQSEADGDGRSQQQQQQVVMAGFAAEHEGEDVRGTADVPPAVGDHPGGTGPVNGVVNGHVNDVVANSNGNGNLNGHANGNGYVHGHANGSGYDNGHANGNGYDISQARVNGYVNGHINGHANGHAAGNCRTANGSGAVDDGVNGAATVAVSGVQEHGVADSSVVLVVPSVSEAMTAAVQGPVVSEQLAAATAGAEEGIPLEDAATTAAAATQTATATPKTMPAATKPIRRIEVESVASAVAAACLSRSSNGGGGSMGVAAAADERTSIAASATNISR